MIVICPNCSTQFAVPAGAIPEEGRKVRCSRCSLEWHQDSLLQMDALSDLDAGFEDETSPQGSFPAKAPIEPNPKIVGPHSHLPALSAKQPAPLWLKLLFLLCFLLAGFAATLRYRDHLPQLHGLYEILGLAESDGLHFEHVTFERSKTGTNFELTVQGEIVNRGTTALHVPPVQIILYTKSGDAVGKLIYPTPERPLGPGEKLHIKPEIANVSATATSMVLDIGNRWETILRPVPEDESAPKAE